MPTVVGEIESGAGADFVEIETDFPVDFVIVVAVLNVSNGLQVGDHACMVIGIDQNPNLHSSPVTRGITWFQKMGGVVGGTGMFDRSNGGSAVMRDDAVPGFVGGTLWDWRPFGFQWWWFSPRAGMKVYYIAVGGDGALVSRINNVAGTLDLGLGAPASVGFAMINELMNNWTTEWPFGGFIAGGQGGLGVTGGYSEFTTETAPLGSAQHAFHFPGVTDNQVIPVYEPIILGSLNGDWVDAGPHADGWFTTFRSINKQVLDWAVRDTDDPSTMRFANASPSADVAWGDGYEPRAILFFGPGPHGNTFGASPLAGTGFGIYGEKQDGTIMNIHLGVGRQDDGTPYSWRYEDRCYVAGFDRAAPAPYDYGRVQTIPGELQWLRDEATAAPAGVGMLAFALEDDVPQLYRQRSRSRRAA